MMSQTWREGRMCIQGGRVPFYVRMNQIPIYHDRSPYLMDPHHQMVMHYYGRYTSVIVGAHDHRCCMCARMSKCACD
jgi:hypothetical protein